MNQLNSSSHVGREWEPEVSHTRSVRVQTFKACYHLLAPALPEFWFGTTWQSQRLHAITWHEAWHYVCSMQCVVTQRERPRFTWPYSVVVSQLHTWPIRSPAHTHWCLSYFRTQHFSSVSFSWAESGKEGRVVVIPVRVPHKISPQLISTSINKIGQALGQATDMHT